MRDARWLEELAPWIVRITVHDLSSASKQTRLVPLLATAGLPF